MVWLLVSLDLFGSKSVLPPGESGGGDAAEAWVCCSAPAPAPATADPAAPPAVNSPTPLSELELPLSAKSVSFSAKELGRESSTSDGSPGSPGKKERSRRTSGRRHLVRQATRIVMEGTKMRASRIERTLGQLYPHASVYTRLDRDGQRGRLRHEVHTLERFSRGRLAQPCG